MGKGPLTDATHAIKRRGTKGVFRRAARRAGMSTRQYAEKEKHAKGKIGRRARLALAFMSASRPKGRF